MGPLAFILVGGLLHFQVDGKFSNVSCETSSYGYFNIYLCLGRTVLDAACGPPVVYYSVRNIVYVCCWTLVSRDTHTHTKNNGRVFDY